jgi:hypothetical protein
MRAIPRASTNRQRVALQDEEEEENQAPEDTNASGTAEGAAAKGMPTLMGARQG